jgi:Mn-dependent DtxR family transcriptional regulator
MVTPMENKNKEFYTFRGYQMIKQNKKLLTPSMEDYMEMIYRNCQKEGYIRIHQLAEQLNVQAPSATRNVQKLAKAGLVDYEKYGIIRLTHKGEEVGRFLLERHMLIESFLKKIGVTDTLLRDTEMIEHQISMDTLGKIELFNKFIEDNPDILERLKKYRDSHTDGN